MTNKVFRLCVVVSALLCVWVRDDNAELIIDCEIDGNNIVVPWWIVHGTEYDEGGPNIHVWPPVLGECNGLDIPVRYSIVPDPHIHTISIGDPQYAEWSNPFQFSGHVALSSELDESINHDTPYANKSGSICVLFDDEYDYPISQDVVGGDSILAYCDGLHSSDGGQIYSMSVYVDFNYYDGTAWAWEETPGHMDALTRVMKHELGHAMGFWENPELPENAGIMNQYWPSLVGMHENEQDTYEFIYGGVFNECCEASFGPCVLSDVDAIYSDGMVDVDILTTYEDELKYVLVERAAQADSVLFTRVDSIAAINDSLGHAYNVIDGIGREGDIYRVSLHGGSSREAVMHVAARADDTRDGHDYTALRAYNESCVVDPYWLDIISGGSVPYVDDVGVSPCTYLVVAHESFIDEIAPLCDYWDQYGYDVVLLGVEITNDRQEDVRSKIQDYWVNTGVQAVMFVGNGMLYDEDGIENSIPLYHEVCGEISWVSGSRQYGTDIPYVDCDGDGYMDIAVGRIPVILEDDLVYYVNKVLHYNNDVTWYGSVPPDYLYTRIHCVPTDDVCVGGGLTQSQQFIRDMGQDVYSEVLGAVGESYYIDYLDTITHMEECWLTGDVYCYQEEAKSAISNDLRAGAHVVIGISEHNWYSNTYALFSHSEWTTRTLDRPCYSFMLLHQCFGGHNRVHTITRTSYELYENKSLIIFGPSCGSWNVVNRAVATRMARALHNKVDDEYDEIPIGIKWMNIYNELYGYGEYYSDSLRNYNVIGDPMLFLRNVQPMPNFVEMEKQKHRIVSISPNPFNPVITIECYLANADYVNACIYDMRGRRVAQILNGELPRGSHVLKWEGSDIGDRAVSSGVYIVRVRIGNVEENRKVTLLR